MKHLDSTKELYSKYLQYKCIIIRTFEDTKGVIRSRTLKEDRQFNDQNKRKGQKRTTNDLKTLHRKLQIEQQAYMYSGRVSSS